MDRIYKSFYYISYLQFPFLVLGVFFTFRPNIVADADVLQDVNLSLIFMGIALSFNSLAGIDNLDKFSKTIFAKPKAAKIWIIYLLLITAFLLIVGIYLLVIAQTGELRELATGITVLGIGAMGLLKKSIEIIRVVQSGNNTIST